MNKLLPDFPLVEWLQHVRALHQCRQRLEGSCSVAVVVFDSQIGLSEVVSVLRDPLGYLVVLSQPGYFGDCVCADGGEGHVVHPGLEPGGDVVVQVAAHEQHHAIAMRQHGQQPTRGGGDAQTWGHDEVLELTRVVSLPLHRVLHDVQVDLAGVLHKICAHVLHLLSFPVLHLAFDAPAHRVQEIDLGEVHIKQVWVSARSLRHSPARQVVRGVKCSLRDLVRPRVYVCGFRLAFVREVPKTLHLHVQVVLFGKFFSPGPDHCVGLLSPRRVPPRLPKMWEWEVVGKNCPLPLEEEGTVPQIAHEAE
mmetsp:Transcript_21698/g.48317  ORF Transcript_21698/g.48317 Transcript_21698/m.48317 type:complete len:307 (-) Transcript_21698:688-1608(-)